ncbi:MAG: hypothetical protein JNM88_08895 [Chitinophagaceae bacterium]|nr:hypothetical protein [Chitinophagaceae bacterium]
MWTDLRQNIEVIRLDKNIPEEKFKPVDTLSWQEIQQKIISTFCHIDSHKDNPNWLWENFKLDTYSVRLERNFPFDSFLQFTDNSETVWLLINDTHNERTKFWLYEGQIKPVVFVLNQSVASEVYIVSKKYDWLLCINHHDFLIATGLYMPGKLKQLEKQTILPLSKDR